MSTTSTPLTTTEAVTELVVGAVEVIMDVDEYNLMATNQNKSTPSQIKSAPQSPTKGGDAESSTSMQAASLAKIARSWLNRGTYTPSKA